MNIVYLYTSHHDQSSIEWLIVQFVYRLRKDFDSMVIMHRFDKIHLISSFSTNRQREYLLEIFLRWYIWEFSRWKFEEMWRREEEIRRWTWFNLEKKPKKWKELKWNLLNNRFSFLDKLLTILGQLLSLSYFCIWSIQSMFCPIYVQTVVNLSFIFQCSTCFFFEQTKKEWNENADTEREERREKVTSRPLGKRVARKTKIELVNRFDNRWQSRKWKISIEWNLFNQTKKTIKIFFLYQ